MTTVKSEIDRERADIDDGSRVCSPELALGDGRPVVPHPGHRGGRMADRLVLSSGERFATFEAVGACLEREDERNEGHG